MCVPSSIFAIARQDSFSYSNSISGGNWYYIYTLRVVSNLVTHSQGELKNQLMEFESVI